MRAVMRHPVRRTASKGVMSKRSASRSSDQEVMRHLSRSQIFKDYERAFSEAMGLPLNIRGHDSWSPAHHGKEDRDSLASILARFNKARAAGLFSDVRPIAGPVSRDVAAAEYFCAAPFDLVESTGCTARKGRVRKHGASAAIHREASNGASVARAGRPRR